MQAERARGVPRQRLRVVLPMALALLVAGFLLRLPDQGGEVLSLRPYLDGPRPAGLAAAWLRDLAARWASPGPWLLPLLSGLCAALVFVVLEAFVRRRWKHPAETAALLPAMLFAVLPGQTALHKVAGGETILLAAVVLLVGLRCLLARRRALAALGLVASLAAVALHPAMLALLPAALGALIVGEHLARDRGAVVAAAALGLILAGSGCFVLGGGTGPAPPLTEAVGSHRAAWALESFLAAPVLGAELAPRTLLPTGYEALAGTWPVAAGVVVWALVSGWALLTGGIAWGASLLAVAILAGLLPPFLVAGWVPGEKGLLLLPLLPLAALLTVLLAAVRAPLVRDASVGLALGLSLVAYLNETGDLHGAKDRDLRREGLLQVRRAVFQLPRLALPGGGDVFNPYAEPDPARLVLYMNDLVTGGHPNDPDLGTCSEAARRLLQRDSPPALDPVWLEERRKACIQDPKAIPLTAKTEERPLFQKLPDLEQLVISLRQKTMFGAAADNYDVAVIEVQQLIPQAMEICLSGSTHPRIVRFAGDFAALLQRIAELATNIGDVRNGIPLREALVELSGREARSLAILGRELLEAGRSADALPVLEEALRRAEPQDVLWTVTRGAHGWARALSGDGQAGLQEMNRAWSDLVGAAQGGQRRLDSITYPDGVDYWLVLEMLLHRYELVREIDPELEEQARRDVERGLDPPLSFGVRRVPALMMKGRLLYLTGDRAGARTLLREMRALKSERIEERAGGATGRFDFPRFRLLGLRTLLEALGPEGELAERAAIEAEIAAIERR